MSAVMEHPALAEVYSRAGASDKDRPAWLAERMGGVTATEIRDLRTGKKKLFDLVELKHGRKVDNFSGNEFTDWGTDREPIIADLVQSRWAIAPESRVFRSVVNPRFLASPDGVGVDFADVLLVSEIKTSGKDIAPWSEAYAETGYEFQMQWSMFVTGAERCLYVWEQRLGAFGQRFAAGDLQHQWIERDEKVIAELVALAEQFLASLDAAAEDGPVIDEHLDTLAVNYLRGLALEKEAKALKEPAYREMLEMLAAGEPVVQESPLARVSYTPAETEERPVFGFAPELARKKAPAGLYERLEQAQNDAQQAQEAVAREQAAVAAHEAKFTEQIGTESVVIKKESLRVTAGKNTKEKK